MVEIELLASQLLRSLRGKRSQLAFSRRLGHRSNVAYAWESGRRFPLASEVVLAAALGGADLKRILSVPLSSTPAWIRRADAKRPDWVSAFLCALRGTMTVRAWASDSGCNRVSLARWMSGKAEPRLPDFLRLVYAAAPRKFFDWLATFVDVARLPAVAGELRRLDALRRIAHEAPLSEAILRFLELTSPTEAPARSQPGFIADQLGISLAQETQVLEALRRAGVIHRRRGRWHIDREHAVDTSTIPRATLLGLKSFWLSLAAGRCAQGTPGVFSYTVFSVSRADLARLERMQVEHYEAMRRVIRASSPCEAVGFAGVQLFSLSRSEDGVSLPPTTSE